MIAECEQLGVGSDDREALPPGVGVRVVGHGAGHEDRGVHLVIDEPVDDRQGVTHATAHIERQRDLVTRP